MNVLRTRHRNFICAMLVFVSVFALIARGGMRIWAQSIVQITIFSLVMFWLFLGLRSKKKEKMFFKTKIDFPLSFFVVVVLISSFFSIYSYASLQSILRLFLYIGIIYLVINTFSINNIKTYVYCIIFAGTFLSLLGLGQYFIGLIHLWWVPDIYLASTFVNHNHFAGFLEMVIPLTFSLVLSEIFTESTSFQHICKRVLLVIAMMIMIAAFIFSQSRGAWISLSVSLVFVLLFLVKNKIISVKALVLIVLTVLIMLAFVFGGEDNPTVRLSSFENIDSDANFLTRVIIWKGTLDLIRNHSFIGTGFGTFSWAFPEYRLEGMNVRAYYAHNDYLHMISEIGIVALPLMLWMLLTIIVSGLKTVKKNKTLSKMNYIDYIVLGGVTGILSLSIHGLVDFNFHIVANMIVFSVLTGIIMGNKKFDFK